MGDVGFLVVGVTQSTGRRWYESKSLGSTQDVRRARVWDEQEKADRWAAMCQHDSDRGRGGVRFHVEARALVHGRVKVEA